MVARAGWFGVAIPVWLAVVVGGFAWLQTYKATPGEVAGPPERWPSRTAIQRDQGRPTLLLFAHPHCPCTRASVSELARLVARFPEVSSRVLFLKPAEMPGGWERTDLWRTVASIPGAVPLRDDDGVETAIFHAATSGFTVLYDADGRLLFSGGLTASRGHEGDSFGQRRIASLLTTGSADRRDSPVFGCALGHPGPASAR
jgi:hypothetical protein